MFATHDLSAVMLRAELRLRLRVRRNSTWLAMLIVMLVVWLTIHDAAIGYTILAANTARVGYNSMALTLGSSVIATTLLGMFGFYLARDYRDYRYCRVVGGKLGLCGAARMAVDAVWRGG